MGIKLNSKPKKEVKVEELKIHEEIDDEDIDDLLEDDEDEEEVIQVQLTPKKTGQAIAPQTLREVVTEAIDDLKNHEVKFSDVEDQTDKVIEKVHQSAVMHTVKNNEGVQKKVLASAEEQVMTSIEIKRNKQQVRLVQATYNANKDACENLGLTDEGRPMWQIRIARVINDFWFIIWAIISTFTLTPIIFFLKRIGTQVKSARLTWLLTFIFYLAIMFLLFLLIASIWSNNPNSPKWIRDFVGGN